MSRPSRSHSERVSRQVKVVQERLGHASAAETLDTYSHLWPDSEDQTRAAVDAVLGSSCVTDVSQLEALEQESLVRLVVTVSQLVGGVLSQG